MKLEIGAGGRPTPGFLHQDITPQQGVELDYLCQPWEIDLPDDSLNLVLALGVIEHLSYAHADMTFAAMRRMLKPGAAMLCDVPDFPVWARYVADSYKGIDVPFSREHHYATVFGWQRWAGDEHKSGWDSQMLEDALFKAGFTRLRWGVKVMLERGYERRRMTRPEDAHLYVEAR